MGLEPRTQFHPHHVRIKLPMPHDRTSFDVLVIGAGPTGMACAIECQRAGFVAALVDKGCLVNSLFHYPANMTFFTTPELLEIGDLPFNSANQKPTRQEALEYCRNPPIFSHSNPFGDTPHPRNVNDRLMRACAGKGGVVGLSGIGPFLGGDTHVVEHLLRQLRYVIDLIGAAHVGLGLDFVFDRSELDEYVSSHPELFLPHMTISGRMGMVEPEAVSAIAEGLARDNLSDDQIRGILGQNWLRIAQQIWRE